MERVCHVLSETCSSLINASGVMLQSILSRPVFSWVPVTFIISVITATDTLPFNIAPQTPLHASSPGYLSSRRLRSMKRLELTRTTTGLHGTRKKRTVLDVDANVTRILRMSKESKEAAWLIGSRPRADGRLRDEDFGTRSRNTLWLCVCCRWENLWTALCTYGSVAPRCPGMGDGVSEEEYTTYIMHS